MPSINKQKKMHFDGSNMVSSDGKIIACITSATKNRKEFYNFIRKAEYADLMYSELKKALTILSLVSEHDEESAEISKYADSVKQFINEVMPIEKEKTQSR